MWAADHHATGSVQITEQDLAPYLHRPAGSTGLVAPVVGEQYRANVLGAGPEAELTHPLGNRFPKGTIIRLRENPPPPYDVILPNRSLQPSGAKRPARETNTVPAPPHLPR